MSDQTRRFNLTVPQIAASALAGTTAAIVGSYLGVAGTVVGAALASMTITVASQVYQHSLERSIQRTAAMAKVRPRNGNGGVLARELYGEPNGAAPETSDADIADPADAADPATVEISDAGEANDEAPGRDRMPRRRFAVAAGALAGFVLAMFVLTGIEAINGGPISGGDGTTFGRVLGRGPGPANQDTPAPVSPTTPETSSSVEPTTSTPVQPSTSAETDDSDNTEPSESDEPTTSESPTTSETDPTTTTTEPKVGPAPNRD